MSARGRICFAFITTGWLGAAVPDGAAWQAQKLSLEAHIQQLTGPATVDCGTHTWTMLLRATPKREAMHRSLACARDATKQHNPFRIIQRGPGTDSEVAFGVLGQADGSVLWFDYDSAPCGGPRCSPRFETKPCLLSNVVVIHDAGGFHNFRCIG